MGKKPQQKYIEILSAEQNNLKAVNVKIPLGLMTAVCGPSGSGKSSLAFETLFAEGQRRYTATLSNYVRQYIQEMPKPKVKAIRNLPPALALEQKNPVRSSRPIVATLTDLADYFRLLFVHAGRVHCPKHKLPLSSHNPLSGAEEVLKVFLNKKGIVTMPVDLPKEREKQNLLKKQFLKQGLIRICWEEKNRKLQLPLMKNLNEIKQFPQKKCFLVLDRLIFKEHLRLVDSLTLAYKLSVQYGRAAGEAKVFCADGRSLHIKERQSCPKCAYTFPLPLEPALFSFNSSLGACSSCRGFGAHHSLDPKKIIPQPWKSLAEGAIAPFTTPSTASELRQLKQFCEREKIDWHCPWEKLSHRHRRQIWKGSNSFIGVEGFFNYLEHKRYKIHVRVFLARYKSSSVCQECKGNRFRRELDLVLFKGKSLPEFFAMDMEKALDFFKKLKLNALEQKKIQELAQKIQTVLLSAVQIGLNYLKLNREVRTLSSGEFQRLNLIHQLGLGLSQVLYVLDEPTVGLHPQDTQKLILLLKNLCRLGNTLVVVEHDADMLKEAEFIVELGPYAGAKGGKVIFSGSKKQFLKEKNTLTSQFLGQKKNRKTWIQRLKVNKKKHKYFLEISGCNLHNLKNVCLRLPLHRLVSLSGLSGSGKSSLVSKTLYPALVSALEKRVCSVKAYFKELKGLQHLRQVVMIDSSPAEKTQRSSPVTYLKFYSFIRQLMAGYAESSSAVRRLLKPGDFSLNVEGGRCPACRGLGYQEVDMVFMDPVRLICEECRGKRFKPEILNWKWQNKNIHQILNMTVQSAMDFFVSHPAIWKPLSLLKKTGLDYLTLGQSLSTLSGGESQRLKLARELLKSHAQDTLYIMDEPTVGLHFTEVELLLKVLKQLIQKGSSVVLIEHNLELLRQCDYLVEMGPGAGAKGGRLQAQGSPEELALNPFSSTGAFLKQFF